MNTSGRVDTGRRTLLKGVAATATAAAVGPLVITERTIAQTRTIYVNTWGGSWTAAEEAAFFKPFTEQTGIRVRTVAPVSYAKLKAQVQSGNYEWDITAVTQADWLRAHGVEDVDADSGLRFSNPSLVIEAALAGLGVGLARSALVASEIRSGRLVRLFDADPGGRVGYHLLRNPRCSAPKVADDFCTWLRATIAAEAEPQR